MQIAPILHALGLLLLCLAGAMSLPFFIAYFSGGPETLPLLISLLCTGGAGLFCFLVSRHRADIGTRAEIGLREGFVIVTAGWILFSAFGALPFYLTGMLPSYTDAYFEAMSGFTTTGATVLTNIEGQPLALHFWRSFMQWLGGMGIIVLSLAILPMLGVGGMQLYKAEVPGPVPDRLVPRIRQTARLLWGLYTLLSVAEVLVLVLVGMPFTEAVLHTFTTMSTGGFSSKAASIGAYQSATIDTVLIVFMFLAGANFALHFQALRGNIRVYRDPEFRFYGIVVLISVVGMTLVLWHQVYPDLSSALRYGAFQVVSIVTTTGFVTADYGVWPFFAQFLLLSFMFLGGCAGSTGGAIKHIRGLLLFKVSYDHLYKLIHPKAVRHVKVGGKVIPKEVLEGVHAFVLLYFFTFFFATASLTLLDMDLVTAIGAVAATLGNVGPGLGMVGPMESYAAIPSVGKWILSACMVLGRLELFTVFVLFTPDLWRSLIWRR
ncbi:MAG: TrkH family potassium uptake protein [candidate division NC10 bacterium]|jgi:trk system potassium uptake protein TrkH|nr:TrkH family potassium uptake protein [candidate division NC10 bacterium]MCH7896200.1 TrkH family potassium uptake protein [candidate division NC10 bacterium]MCZ6550825.1 TrkH family potassium uptake protein [candidate division NC10 bacterium]